MTGVATTAPAAEVPGVERVSSSDQIAREIMRGLYQGRYVPGQKLTEADLARRFGVGRGSVREALKRLAAEGIVTVSLHRGASIRALSRQEARDVLEVVEVLAVLAARRAAERLDVSKAKTLHDMLEALTVAASAPESFEFGRLRDRFYRQLAHISGNEELARLMPAVQTHILRVQFRASGPDADNTRVQDYQAIIEAVLANDGAKAERAMRQHVRRTAQIIDTLPDEAFAY